MTNTYRHYLETTYGINGEGSINEFISRSNGRLIFAGVDLGDLVKRHGAPLEINYCPLITEQIMRMEDMAATARATTEFNGDFIYAYATKANFSEEVVRTALQAGAHYETSAAGDVLIATALWQQGILDSSRYVFCNGSKEDNYIEAILRMRAAGYTQIVPVIDDLEEWHAYRLRGAPLKMGVRAREFARCSGGDRFGLISAEIEHIIDTIPDTNHELVLYHAMVGSQIEDMDAWISRLEDAVEAYCLLRRRLPTLHMFSIGGGMPTSAYNLNFSFDYATFLQRLFATIKTICARYDVPVPDLVGEFGRYTVANYSAYLFEVGQVKEGRQGGEPWYLVNGSLMVSLPDILIVPDQEFIMLPLDQWDATVQGVRLGGRRTCDSDDVYPRSSMPPLMLPTTNGGLVLAVFGVGAYQQMISGRGGAHHCLNPEMKRLIIEQVGDKLVTHEIAPQDLSAITNSLGYDSFFTTSAAVAVASPSVPTLPMRPRKIFHSRLRRRHSGWLSMVNVKDELDDAEMRLSS